MEPLIKITKTASLSVKYLSQPDICSENIRKQCKYTYNNVT